MKLVNIVLLCAALCNTGFTTEPCAEHSAEYQECLENSLLQHSLAVDHLNSALDANKQLNEALSKRNQELSKQLAERPNGRYWFWGGVAVGVIGSTLIYGLVQR